MPIYEYECKSCGVYELSQKITEPAREKCETCGAPVRRLISATSFALKGSGWYVTDYAGKGKNEAKTEKSDSSGGGCGAGACGAGGCGMAEA